MIWWFDDDDDDDYDYDDDDHYDHYDHNDMIVNGIWRVFLLLLPKRVQMALRYLYIPLPSQPAALLASFSIRPSCISSLCTFRRYWFWSNFFGCCFRFRQLLLPKCMVDPQTLSNSVSIGSNNCRQGNKARNKLGNRLWVPTVAPSIYIIYGTAGCHEGCLLFFFLLRDLFCFSLPACLMMTWWCSVVAVAIASLHQRGSHRLPGSRVGHASVASGECGLRLLWFLHSNSFRSV